MSQKAESRMQKAGRVLKHARLLTALCLLPTIAVLAVGAPLSQLVHLVEIESKIAGSAAEKSYSLLLPAELDELARSSAKTVEHSSKESQKSKAPRLLKAVPDCWDTIARVQIDAADAPVAVNIFVADESLENAIPQFTKTLYLSHSPPGPHSTGPPAII